MTTKLRPLAVPVPRLKRTVGLGDAVKKFTTWIGIQPCGGCKRRAAALNQVLVFRGTGKPGNR